METLIHRTWLLLIAAAEIITSQRTDTFASHATDEGFSLSRLPRENNHRENDILASLPFSTMPWRIGFSTSRDPFFIGEFISLDKFDRSFLRNAEAITTGFDAGELLRIKCRARKTTPNKRDKSFLQRQ